GDAAGEVDHARGRGGAQQREQQEGQGVGRQDVLREGGLDAGLGQGACGGHATEVVDQHVEPVVPGAHLGGERSQVRRSRQVGGEGGRAAEFLGGGLGAAPVAAH